jgi:hypothetical protein
MPHQRARRPGSKLRLVANVGHRVFVDPGRSNLKPDARTKLHRRAARLSHYGEVSVLIAGNTSEREGGTQWPRYRPAAGEQRPRLSAGQGHRGVRRRHDQLRQGPAGRIRQ